MVMVLVSGRVLVMVLFLASVSDLTIILGEGVCLLWWWVLVWVVQDWIQR